ncbi:hypothetical protein [Aquimarina aggregata]|uniref:hypothetical protein n=1 Tax=Aquimarina aggregata TaxID=1642818 RepID=UPI0024918315|nr:hypothetical protein [Aquimarina aggregata]
MTAVERYNDLHKRIVTRDRLKRLLEKAIREKEQRVVTKLKKLLQSDSSQTFEITIAKKLREKKEKIIRQSKPQASRKKRTVSKQKSKLVVKGMKMPVVVVSSKKEVTPQMHITPSIKIDPPKPIPKKSTSAIGLKSPVVPKPKTKPIQGLPTMADLDHIQKPTDTFKLNTELGTFLGDLERKPVHSVVVTLDAPAGSGKTRVFFQAMQDYASDGKKCLFFTLEEHSQSDLFKKKRDQYISPDNYGRITIIDDVTCYDQFKKLVALHDVIFVDSFGKLKRLIKSFKLELDEHIRKAFDSKLFFLIFQRTSDGSMRGGADAAFDGDVILQVEKPSEDYRENYLIARKNRYNEIPMLKYSIYHQNIIHDDALMSEEPIPPKQSPKHKLIVRSL